MTVWVQHSRPYGTHLSASHRLPAINRWATINRPSRTTGRIVCQSDHSPKLSRPLRGFRLLVCGVGLLIFQLCPRQVPVVPDVPGSYHHAGQAELTAIVQYDHDSKACVDDELLFGKKPDAVRRNVAGLAGGAQHRRTVTSRIIYHAPRSEGSSLRSPLIDPLGRAASRPGVDIVEQRLGSALVRLIRHPGDIHLKDFVRIAHKLNQASPVQQPSVVFQPADS